VIAAEGMEMEKRLQLESGRIFICGFKGQKISISNELTADKNFNSLLLNSQVIVMSQPCKCAKFRSDNTFTASLPRLKTSQLKLIEDKHQLFIARMKVFLSQESFLRSLSLVWFRISTFADSRRASTSRNRTRFVFIADDGT
jgi:hypothetical protein